MSWRAFDKTVRREPLAFAVDSVYGNSIDLELEVIAKKEVVRKALSLMFVNVLLLAFTPMIVTPRLFFFQAKALAPIHAAASAAYAASFKRATRKANERLRRFRAGLRKRCRSEHLFPTRERTPHAHGPLRTYPRSHNPHAGRSASRLLIR